MRRRTRQIGRATARASALRLLGLRHLRRHKLRSLLAVAALGAGTSLAMSVLIVTQSVSTSMRTFGNAVAGGAQLKVIGSTPEGGISPHLLTVVRNTQGVRSAAGVVQAVTIVQSRNARPAVTIVLGVGCSQALPAHSRGCTPPFGLGSTALSSQAAPAGTAQLPDALVAPDLVRRMQALRARGHAEASMQLRTDTGLVSLAGARQIKALDNVDAGRLIVLPLETAQRLFDRGRNMDAIYVTAGSGTSIPKLQSRLRSTVGGWNGVLPAGAPPPETSIASNAIIPMLLVVAVLASGIAAVLVYNIISLSLEERRKENAILAALGATRATIMMGPLVEGALLGTAGGLVGSAGGWLIAKPVASTLSTFTKTLAGAPVLIHVTPATFVIGALMGIALGVVAAVRPALRAARAGVAAELSRRDRRSAASPRALALKAGASLGITAIALLGCWLGQYRGALRSWQPPLAEASFFVTVTAVVIATASIAPLIMVGARKVTLGTKTLAGLALSNLAREPGRTGVMAIAVAASVGTAFITASFNQSVHAGLSESLSGAGSRGVFVATTARNSSVTVDAKLPPSVVQRLARVPGVAAVNAEVAILAGHSAGHLVEVEASTQPMLDLGLYVGRASLARFQRGQVLVGAALARRLNLSPGGRLRIDTPHGYAYMPVQGVWGDGTLVGENVTVPMSTMTRLWGPQLPAVVEVTPGQAVSPIQLVRNIRAAHVSPGLQVLTANQVLTLASSIAASQLAPFWTLQHALLLVAFVAVLATLLLVGVERDREMATLLAVGLSPAGMVRMVISEAAILGATGAALGVALGFPGVIALNEISPIFIGFSNPLRFDLTTLAVYVPLAIAASLAAAALPAWRAMRLDVIRAINYE